MNKKVILMILDGWGHSPDPKVSAIDHAKTPYIDSLYRNYAHAKLRTDGLHVGLPEGQMGNSEVGHMNLGAGRIVYQDLAKINLAVQNKTLQSQPVLKKAIAYAKSENKPIHLLLSIVLYMMMKSIHNDIYLYINKENNNHILILFLNQFVLYHFFQINNIPLYLLSIMNFSMNNP